MGFNSGKKKFVEKKLESVKFSFCQVVDPFTLCTKIKEIKVSLFFIAFLQFFKNVMRIFRNRLQISLQTLSEVKLINKPLLPLKSSEKHGFSDDFRKNRSQSIN